MTDLARTRTGGFPIGVRRGWGAWQRDLPAYLEWVRRQRLSHVDLGNDAGTIIEKVGASGVEIGAVDLPRWKELLSGDPGLRRAAIDEAGACIEGCAAAGVKVFMTIMLPEDPTRPREENFDHMILSYSALVPVLEEAGAAIAIEGWPGPGALCCSPETLRALFLEIPSEAIGINFDPSHLLRLQIDPIRFLEEFANRVRHVHAKDTEWMPERAYEFGIDQPATFSAPHRFGGHSWRYTIPGHGHMRWTEALLRLHAAGYAGRLSIELEDEDFHGSESSEQRGIVLSRDFLLGC